MSEFFTDDEKLTASKLQQTFSEFQNAVAEARALGLSIDIKPAVGRKALETVREWQIAGASLKVTKTREL